jgi:hypothetical protein
MQPTESFIQSALDGASSIGYICTANFLKTVACEVIVTIRKGAGAGGTSLLSAAKADIYRPSSLPSLKDHDFVGCFAAYKYRQDI